MLKKLVVVTVVLAVAAIGASIPNTVPVPKGVEIVSIPVLPSEPNEEGAISYTSGNVFQTAGYQAGITIYDYQTNGAMGNRIAVDDSGDVHICWMHDDDEDFVNRDIYYNFWKKSTVDFIWGSGVKASGTGKAGYATMGLLSDGRAVVAYHHDPDGDGVHQSAVSIDAIRGAGAFSSPIDVDPVTVPAQPIWPRIVIGPDDVIHVTAHIHWAGTGDQPADYKYLYYSRSTDGGVSFSPWQVISEEAGSDAAMAMSADGGKVAIAWVAPFPITGTDNKFATHGNVRYVESTNSGASWSSEVEITDGFYTEEQPNTGDTITLGAIANSLDCAYDASGNLHIAWGDAWRSAFENPDDNFNVWFRCFPRWFQRLMHYSEVTDTFYVVSSMGVHDEFTQFPYYTDGTHIDEFLDMGFWGLGPVVEKYINPGLGCWNPQLAAIGPDDDMVYIWTGQWDSLDLTAAGTINADLYAAITTDGGGTWVPVADWTLEDIRYKYHSWLFSHITNLTNTHSPGARIGESLSEEYHSVWPWIGSDSILHITYIHDLFAGSCLHDPTTNIFTENPVMYLPVKVKVGDGPPDPAVGETRPVELTQIKVLGKHPVAGPVAFSVNAPVTYASLKIYDAAGNLVKTLFEGRLGGNRVITWDASAVAAGVYFYRFVTPAQTTNGRVVVVH